MKIFTSNHPDSIDLKSSARRFKSFAKIMILLLGFLFSMFSSFAQIAAVDVPTGGFNIDGTLNANTSAGDWTDGTGSGGYVFMNDGTPVIPDPLRTWRLIDAYDSGEDIVFSGGKINDNPGTWTWQVSKPNGKADVNNALLFLSKNETTNDQWLFVAGDRFSSSGATNINFEFLQKDLTRNPTGGGFTNSASALTGGRTENDVLISMEYGGGAVSTLKLYLWKNSGGWKYVEQVVSPTNIFGRSNTAANTPVPFGAFGSTVYASSFQFSEAAINISDLFLNIDACLVVKVFTVMISTRTGGSISSGLEDMVEPISVRLDLGNSISYGGSSFCPTGTVTVSKSGGTSTGTFSSTPSGLSLDSSTGTIDLSLSIPNTYTVTYTYTTPQCSEGRTSTATVIINPYPEISNINSSVCSGSPFAITPVNGTNGVVPSGTTYSWSVPVVSNVGLTGGVAGSGASISGTLTNTTGTAQTATYIVTPTATCDEDPKKTFTVTITVDAKPAITGPITTTICSDGTFSVIPVTGTNGVVPSGTTYSWTVPVVTGGLTGGVAGSGSSISGTLYNPTGTVQTATYTVTPVSGGCTGSTFTVVVTVNPLPIGSASPQTICSGTVTNIGLNSSISSTTYTWTAAQLSGSTITGFGSGSGSTIAQTLTNTTNAAAGVVRYTITPTSPAPTSCVGNVFTVDVTVNSTPSISCPANITVSNDAGLCTASVPFTATATGTPTPTITYKIGATVITSPYIFPKGTTTVDVVASNGCSPDVMCSFTVTVTDNENPTITAPVNITRACGESIAPSSTGTATATDNCTPPSSIIISYTDDITLPVICGGIITRTWKAKDASGNEITGQQTITVSPSALPTMTAPADITVSCGGLPASSTISFSNGLIGDCLISGTSNASTFTTTPDACGGTVTETWTATDACGRQLATVTRTITVDDNTAPTFTAPANTTVYTSTTCTYDVTVAATGDVTNEADNCSTGLNATFVDAAPVAIVSQQGGFTIARTWSLVDNCGNAAVDQVQIITVNDNTLPTITAPIAVSVSSDADKCTASDIVLGIPVTSDNCSVGSVTNDAPSAFPVGQTTVTWTVTDGSGNTAQATQLVTVTDNINPTITAPLATTGTTNVDCTSTNVVLGTPVTADNCSVGSVTNDAPSAFPVGQTTVTWTVTDGSGNTAQATQLVTVTDNINPTIICAPNAASYPYKIPGTELDPAISDNCSIASVTNNYNNSASLQDAEFPLGTTIVTWTVTDGSGNKATCSSTVVVNDIQPPTISCATVPVASYEVDQGSCTYKISGTTLDPTITDNDEGASVANNFNNGFSLNDAQFPIGETIVIWTVTDRSGNTATCTQTIRVNDTQYPTIACPANISADVDAGKCTASGLVLGTPVANDNCTVSLVSNNAPDVFPLGQTIVTWTVTDSSGNMTTCSQTVTVNGLPVAVDDFVTVDEDSEISGNVMANDYGMCDIPVQVKAHTEPAYGALTLASDGGFTYTPDDNFNGTDTFTYQICDLNGDCSTATVLITVNSVNDVPVANDDIANVNVDGSLSDFVDENDLWSGDGGNEYTLVTPPSNGSVFLNPDGSYTYTPNISFIGTDSFSYKLCDGDGDCDEAKVTISVEDILLPYQILTPNGDGINDRFIIKGIELYPNNRVTIFNRWGNVVFDKNGYLDEWDGNSNSNKIGIKSLPSGTYYFVIDYGSNRHKTGFVQLDK